MKKFKRILSLILAVLPMLYTAVAVFFFMPERVAAHFDIHGNIDRYGSKYEAFLLPAILLVMYGIVMIVRHFTEKSSTDDEKTRRNSDIGDTVMILILVLLNAVDILTLTAMNQPTIFSDAGSLASVIVSVIVGIVFILLGNIMPKTKRNHIMGMRMKFCMDTDEHWYIANRAGGIALVLAGLVTIAAGLILRSVAYIFVMVIALIVFLTVATFYSYVIIKKTENG